MSNKIMLLSFLVFAVAGLALAPVMAQPAGGEVDIGASERGEGTAADTVIAEGGNVTQVNVSGTSITGRWAGFWGTISGGIALSDASNNSFYEWTVSDVTGSVVYAADGSVSDWTTVTAASSSDQITFVDEPATDNFTNTFTGTDDFSSASIATIPSVPVATTLQNDSSTNLRTFALMAGSTRLFAAVADAGEVGFNSETVDYQLLAPADSGTVTYTFYLELP